MLNPTAIAATLSGLVGWHPAAGNPTGELHLSTLQLQSRSGLYVNDLHELLRLSVLVHAVPRGETLEAWITRLATDALLRLTSRLAQAQGLDGKVLVADAPLMNTPGRAGDTINKLGRFVGIRLSLGNRKGTAWAISALTLQLDSVLTADLPLYLYSDAQAEPVKVLTIAAGANRANYPYSVNVDGENALDIAFATAPGTFAYLGYYEDDLGNARAINKEFTGLSCGCTNDPWAQWNTYAIPRGFTVAADKLNSDLSAWLPTDAVADSSNFGLNLSLLGYCDPAKLFAPGVDGGVSKNSLALAELVQLALAIRFIEALHASPNITQLTQREDVQADAMAFIYTAQAKLYGGKDLGTESDYYPGLLKTVELDVSGCDSACIPQPASRLSMGSLIR